MLSKPDGFGQAMQGSSQGQLQMWLVANGGLSFDNSIPNLATGCLQVQPYGHFDNQPYMQGPGYYTPTQLPQHQQHQLLQQAHVPYAPLSCEPPHGGWGAPSPALAASPATTPPEPIVTLADIIAGAPSATCDVEDEASSEDAWLWNMMRVASNSISGHSNMSGSSNISGSICRTHAPYAAAYSGSAPCGGDIDTWHAVTLPWLQALSGPAEGCSDNFKH